MDLIKSIGPALGIIAFIALAGLAYLIFQQAKEIRRLREWAGRAPERALDATEAATAASEARGEATGRERHGRGFTVLGRRIALGPGPLAGIGVALIAAVIGFAVLGGGGDESSSSGGGGPKKAKGGSTKIEVAVLNGTQVTGVSGVPGLADKVVEQVLNPAGYVAGVTTDSPTGFAESVVMFEPGSDAAGAKLAGEVEAELGPTAAEPMIQAIRDVVEGAKLVLVIGADDSAF